MRRKTDFKQMFLIDSSLYKRVNSPQQTPSAPVPVCETPTFPPESVPSVKTMETDTNEIKDASTQTDDVETQSPSRPNDEKFFDGGNPIVKALKEDYEKSDEFSEPAVKKARYENNDNEIDFKQMINEIDEEIKNWYDLRKDAVKMRAKTERKRKQPRYVHYFTDKDGSVRNKST